MQTLLLNKKSDYDGSQLASHWIFDTAGITGNACVAFIGGCNISLEHMVDLADKKDKCKIFSREMLHFIAERFDTSLDEMVLHQRLLVSIIADTIRQHQPCLSITRKGNDLFDIDSKLNVSIATASPVSMLLHVGVNIRSDGTPVKTKGLKDYGIEPKTFAEEVLKSYKEEIEGIKIARAKVRWVK